jgi:hypothetical protein
MSVCPAAATIASTAAADSCAPRLVCTTTPVAFSTGRTLAARTGRAATATSATAPGEISPRRAWACAASTAARTCSGPIVSAAAARRGSTRIASVVVSAIGILPGPSVAAVPTLDADSAPIVSGS